MGNTTLKQIFAEPGYCFTNRDESQIYYICIWTTEKDMKQYHQITLERAKEIVAETRGNTTSIHTKHK